MKEYKRKEPSFSLCGLNCALCPRFHTDGSSKCPGCGGPDFLFKHPICSVVTCNKKHDNVEFCYECSSYPCKKYTEPNITDSFISYKNVLQNMADAKRDLPEYLKTLKMKQEILEYLIINFYDGKSKGFYCLAVNLLPLSELKGIITAIRDTTDMEGIGTSAKAKKITDMMKAKANEMQIELKLRK